MSNELKYSNFFEYFDIIFKRFVTFCKFSIKNAATYQQKSKNPKFFYLFPYKHLQILAIRKTRVFSAKCASRSNSGGPERSRAI